MATIGQLSQIIAPAVTALDYEFVGCEFAKQGERHILRVYVDSPNGINLDACAKLSRQIGAVLEVEDPIATRFNLEVSSPGLDRPLYTLAHYTQFVGEKIRLKTRYPQAGGQRNFMGILAAVDGEQVSLQTEDSQTVTFAFGDIDRANIIPNI